MFTTTLKQIPWRLEWVVQTKAFEDRPLRTMWRLFYWTAAELFSRTTTFLSPEGLKLASMRNNIGTMAAYVSSDFENDLHDFVAKTLKPGDVFCDVGANIGRYTVQAAKLVGPAGVVVSFEAHPETYQFLSRNVENHGLDNVLCANVAVGEEQGTACLKFERRDAGSTHISLPPSKFSVVVPQVKLDDVLSDYGIDRLNYLKIDVEGFELPVVRGANRVIANSESLIIQTEIDPHHLARYNIPLSDLTGYLDGMGFAPYVLDHHGVLSKIKLSDIVAGDFIWRRAHTC